MPSQSLSSLINAPPITDQMAAISGGSYVLGAGDHEQTRFVRQIGDMVLELPKVLPNGFKCIVRRVLGAGNVSWQPAAGAAGAGVTILTDPVSGLSLDIGPLFISVCNPSGSAPEIYLSGAIR